MFDVTLGKLDRFFPSDVIGMGQRLKFDKNVEFMQNDSTTGTIEACIHTSRFKPVNVRLAVGAQNGEVASLTFDCECDKPAPCVHMAAVLSAMEGWDGVVRFAKAMTADPTTVSRHVPKPPMNQLIAITAPEYKSSYVIKDINKIPDDLPPNILEWQQKLAASQSLAANPIVQSLKPKKTVIVYVLASATFGSVRELKVDVLKAAVRKDGTLGRVDDYNPYYTHRGGAFVTPEDVDIFRLLAVFGLVDGYRTTAITDKFTTQALKTIVATGRCYFMSADRPPLTWGPPRKGAPDWTVNDSSLYHTCLVLEQPAEVFIGHPFLYVDMSENTIGLVETELPFPVIKRWLSAPSVAPKHHQAITQFTQEQHLPSPPPLPEAEMLDTPLQPKLTLFSSPQRGESIDPNTVVINPEKYVHWASVKFYYGDIAVEPERERETTIDRSVNGKRYIVKRDLAQEETRLDELEQSKLALASRLDLYWLPISLSYPAYMLPMGDRTVWNNWIAGPMHILQAAGWTIEFDPSFILHRVKVDNWFLDTTDAEGDQQDWFNIDLGIVVDGQRISLLPILRNILADSHPSIEKMTSRKSITVSLHDGRCIEIPVQRLEKMRELLIELYSINPNTDQPLKVDRLRAAQLAGTDGWQWNGSQRVCDLVKKLSEPKSTPAPPANLNATLRPYQLEGLNWLQFLREYDLAGVLADDMGLGKTIQALTHLLTEKQAGRLDRPALVVAPTSLMGNWRDETNRFAPDLRLLVLHGSGRHEHLEKLSDYDLIVTSYPLLARDQDLLKRQSFHVVILDEAQTIKNPATLYAQAARKLTSRHRLALTGTPMENHLGELWAIFDFLMPGFLGNHTQFRKLFRDPIEKGGDEKRRRVLAQRIAPLVLRRRKSEVALELPPKNEMVQNIELAGAQRDLYESIRVSMESRVREQIASLGLARSHIVILDALLKLRQVCCDPRLLKIPSAREVHESAKLEWLVQALPSMVEDGRRILLFSQFTSMLDIIEEKLTELTIRFVRLTGDTRDRDTPVKSFQLGEVPVFLISLKAGGTGLNLTAADTVIHYDPWWNPAVENQATDRAHRIGQDKTVFVYKLITQGTVEEKIQALQQRKAQLLAGLLDESGKSPLKLGEDDLRALFAPLK